MEKLFVVVRADLPPGSQAVQAVHSAIQFAAEHGERERRWLEESSHLAFLEVADEAELARLCRAARLAGVQLSEFREPDLGGSLTSATLAPEAKRLCRRLRKALSRDGVLSGNVARERQPIPPEQ